VRARNPGPFTLTGTNSWIIGREPAHLIDPGPSDAAHVAAQVAAIEERGGLAGILLTHDHRDHSAGVSPLRERFDVPLAASGGEAEITLRDGDRFGPLTALATPGHAGDHLAFLAGGVCFSGDLVLGEGSVVLGSDPHALADYLASLRRLRALDLELIAPGHGPLVEDPAARLDEYLAHRLERERALLAALDEGLRERDELLDRVWPAVPAALRGAAAQTLAAHLEKLAGEGRLPDQDR
jgi:glyoxylase-like metal-dependent hydrolase (beta-lactamase superfamily II)